MKDVERQNIINHNKREYLKTLGKLHGVPGHNRGNTLEHELKKYEIALNCERDGHEVLIEPQLKNGKRPDVLIIDVFPPIAYEVAKSETNKSLFQKQEDYGDIHVIPVRL